MSNHLRELLEMLSCFNTGKDERTPGKQDSYQPNQRRPSYLTIDVFKLIGIQDKNLQFCKRLKHSLLKGPQLVVADIQLLNLNFLE